MKESNSNNNKKPLDLRLKNERQFSHPPFESSGLLATEPFGTGEKEKPAMLSIEIVRGSIIHRNALNHKLCSAAIAIGRIEEIL